MLTQAQPGYVIHRGQENGRGPSPRLWSKMRGQELSPDGASVGSLVGDNFLNFGAIAPAVAGTKSYGAHGGYGAYVDTTGSAGSIKQLADAYGGVGIATGATDNHESWLTSGGNTGAIGKINAHANSPGMVIFEASISLGQIGDNGGAPFVGLASPGSAVENAKVDNTGVLGPDAYLGFDVVHADGDAINLVCKAAGQAAVVLISGVKVPEADTQLKLGFIYDPSAPGGQRIRVFVGNIESDTTIGESVIDSTTFPEGEWLSFLVGLKNGSASASQMNCHWWYFYQAGSV